jgi:hypothetical protein
LTLPRLAREKRRPANLILQNTRNRRTRGRFNATTHIVAPPRQ